MDDDNKNKWKTSQIAEYSKFSQKWVREQLQSGHLKGEQIGGLWYAEKTDVDEWMAKKKAGDTTITQKSVADIHHGVFEASIADHHRVLMAFGCRLRDRLYIQHPAYYLNLLPPPQGLIWRGEQNLANSSTTSSAEDDRVATLWRRWDRDQRNHPYFRYLKSHLLAHPCWPTLAAAESAHQMYADNTSSLWSNVLSVVKNTESDMTEDSSLNDAEVVIKQIVNYEIWNPSVEETAVISKAAVGIWLQAAGLKPVSLPADSFKLQQTTEVVVSDDNCRKALKAWSTTAIEFSRLIQEWKEHLGDDEKLRKLILEGTCKTCPN